VHTVSGLAIGIGVGSGAGGVLVVLIALVVTQKLKRRRKEMLKRTFFEQNRGRLLQQLVSQRTDIAERMIIPLAELEKATNNFDRTRELGGGGHGTVYKGILSNLHVVAIKKPKMLIQREIDEFINEVAILSQINHRHVVKLYGCCLETEVPMLVYEFISNGTLSDHLHINEPKSLPWDDRLRIATETAKSLAYLHMTVSTPIIDRDIKSANILLDNTLAAKVADFGASRYIPVDKTGVTTMVQGTRGYLDPMYLSTGRLTEKSDVYSFGVMLIELLTRKKPFSYFSSEGEGLVGHFATLFADGNFSQILDPQVVDTEGKVVEEVAKLALACVKLAGEDRPTMRDVELTLEGLKPSKRHVLGSAVVEASKEDAASTSVLPSTCLPNRKESSRQYSMEEEFLLSAKYPR
jgi:serine/threonine protein kinase